MCHYPLKKYYINILDFIENHTRLTKNEHQANVGSRIVIPGIGFAIGKPIGPEPYCCFGKIFLNEAFLGFLWAVVYWLFTSFEKIYVAAIFR